MTSTDVASTDVPRTRYAAAQMTPTTVMRRAPNVPAAGVSSADVASSRKSSADVPAAPEMSSSTTAVPAAAPVLREQRRCEHANRARRQEHHRRSHTTSRNWRLHIVQYVTGGVAPLFHSHPARGRHRPVVRRLSGEYGFHRRERRKRVDEMNELDTAIDELSFRLRPDRYSAKNNVKPVNFYCVAPKAKRVCLVGDFNGWNPLAHPMKRQPDGSWTARVELHHGYHRYLFLVDGFRGKVGGIVYAQQPNGTITARSVGVRTAKQTEQERKGQHRMKLGHDFVRGVLGDPVLKAVYASEAQARKMRTCDLVMSDFLTDPTITSVNADKYIGLAGGWLFVMTGDDFKVTRVGIVLRNASGQRLEEGFAVQAQGSAARVWIYTAQQSTAAGQILIVEVTATDRAGHSTILTVTHPI